MTVIVTNPMNSSAKSLVRALLVRCKSQIAVLVLLLLSCSLLESTYACQVPNDCSMQAPNIVCAFSASNQTHGKCVQCDFTSPLKDCYCPLGQYCISDSSNVRNWLSLSLELIRQNPSCTAKSWFMHCFWNNYIDWRLWFCSAMAEREWLS